MQVPEVATRVAGLADDLTDEAARLRTLTPPARAFAGDGPGALFAAGAALHAQWQAALAAREREALDHGARLAGLAGALRRTGEGYAAAEDSSHRAHGPAAS
jgi:hypothetical protein